MKYLRLFEDFKEQNAPLDHGTCEVIYEPRGDNGLEGYDRGQKYDYVHMSHDKTGKHYYRIYHGHSHDSYDTCGPGSFKKYFKSIDNRQGGFEKTNEDAQSVMMNPANQGTSPKVYMYHIHKDSKGEDFHATIRDPDGKVIFEIKGDRMFGQDGEMKDKNDVGGLTKMLTAKNKIRQGDTVVPSQEYGKISGQETTNTFNTNPTA